MNTNSSKEYVENIEFSSKLPQEIILQHLEQEFNKISREEKLRILNPSIMEFIRFKLSKLWNRN